MMAWGGKVHALSASVFLLTFARTLTGSMMQDISSLYRRLYRPLCLYSLKFLGDYEAVEDIVQDCFAAFLDNNPDVKNARAYLYAAVRNRCVDAIRMQGREILMGPDFDREDTEAVEESFLSAEVWARIEALPPRQRQMLLMSKRDGMKYSEIAGELRLSEQTVKNQVSRALKKLKKLKKLKNMSENSSSIMVLFVLFSVL